jgi:anti-sigma factor ChrR (cupin superfamily)
MEHPTDETLAEFALGLLGPAQRAEVAKHLEACEACNHMAADYRGIGEALQSWREAPPDLVAAAQQRVTQRLRLHALLDRLLADADLRRRVQEDPAGLLSAHGITPTPELLAAFKDLDASPARFPHELDERITKFRRLLEAFPGAPPPLDV